MIDCTAEVFISRPKTRQYSSFWKGEDDEMEIHILSYKFKLLKTYCQCLGLGDTSLQCIIALTKKHLVKKSQMIKELGMKTTEVLWSQ